VARRIEIVAIGTSTGGPNALESVFRALPVEIAVPVVVVQHMPPVFTKMLAERLDGTSRISVREAQAGDLLRPGQALIAPGGRHLVLKPAAAGAVVALTDDPPENFVRPAVDVMFRSAAACYRDRVLGLVLTGMGRDGAKGAKVIRDAGGEMFVQDEATSVVWGMPGAVAAAGQADRVLPLQGIAAELSAVLARKPAGVAR